MSRAGKANPSASGRNRSSSPTRDEPSTAKLSPAHLALPQLHNISTPYLVSDLWLMAGEWSFKYCDESEDSSDDDQPQPQPRPPPPPLPPQPRTQLTSTLPPKPAVTPSQVSSAVLKPKPIRTSVTLPALPGPTAVPASAASQLEPVAQSGPERAALTADEQAEREFWGNEDEEEPAPKVVETPFTVSGLTWRSPVSCSCG